MTSNAIEKVLVDAPAFSGLGDEYARRLAEHGKEIEIANGEVLFRSGEPAKSFFLLVDGEISIEIPAVSGPTLRVQRLTPVRVLGWSWLLPPFKWSFNAKGERDSKLIAFDGEAVLEACEADPAFGYEVIKRFSGLMAERLDAAHRRMMEQWSPAGFA